MSIWAALNTCCKVEADADTKVDGWMWVGGWPAEWWQSGCGGRATGGVQMGDYGGGQAADLGRLLAWMPSLVTLLVRMSFSAPTSSESDPSTLPQPDMKSACRWRRERRRPLLGSGRQREPTDQPGATLVAGDRASSGSAVTDFVLAFFATDLTGPPLVRPPASSTSLPGDGQSGQRRTRVDLHPCLAGRGRCVDGAGGRRRRRRERVVSAVL